MLTEPIDRVVPNRYSLSMSEFIDLKTASEIVEPPLPIATIRGWIYRGKLKSYRPGRKRLVRKSEFIAFIEGGKQ